MQDRYSDIKSKIKEQCENDSEVRTVIIIGSSTRADTPADEFSDLDLIIVTENTEKWYLGEYPELFGRVSISFTEPTLGGGIERRCIYDDDKDVDMIIFTPLQFSAALKKGEAGRVMNRGYKMLIDKDGYAEKAAEYVSPEISSEEITESEFENLANDFYFHNIWALKKLKRGELWSAKMCIDSYLKSRLLKMIEQYQLCKNTKDIWHDGRFLDSWAESSVTERLKKCFAHYDSDDCKAALLETHSLFTFLAEFVAKKRGFSYPEAAKKCAAKYLSGK